MRICIKQNCNRIHYGKGLCKSHYHGYLCTINPNYRKKCIDRAAKWVRENREKHAKFAQRSLTKRLQQIKNTIKPCELEAIKKLYRDCPVGHEVDHIIPLSRGGTHTLDNLRYLTVSENRKKLNRLDWEILSGI